jgi:4-diphosphocytidyl-2-C-methyl-D-erythritol kinase
MRVERRQARLQAPAKINLVLEVLNKRPDGFHNIRTIFQTISLADILDIEFTPGRVTRIHLDCGIDIPANLVVRAAEAVLDASNASGLVTFRLAKKIPLGGGLGGGSTDAAAVLLALPVLTGRALPMARVLDIAADLGSDVPFFLSGGAALGLGRGIEFYPIADPPIRHALVVFPGVHVSTAEAYSALGRSLTSTGMSPKINTSQSFALALGGDEPAEGWAGFCSNDFESVVFRRHPQLGAIKNKLKKAGARPALMTGSGAAIFGVFETVEMRYQAQQSFGNWTSFKGSVFPVSFIGRRRYRALWRRQLAEHIEGREWPPRSRYSR